MDKLTQYRKIVQQVLLEYVRQHPTQDDNLELQPIFDQNHDRYQLLYAGWHRKKRIFTPILQFDIKNDKIWLQHNTTESDPTVALLELGIPKTDIVLGFHSPSMRRFTEFAVS